MTLLRSEVRALRNVRAELDALCEVRTQLGAFTVAEAVAYAELCEWEAYLLRRRDEPRRRRGAA